jgi:hypothetical protein
MFSQDLTNREKDSHMRLMALIFYTLLVGFFMSSCVTKTVIPVSIDKRTELKESNFDTKNDAKSVVANGIICVNYLSHIKEFTNNTCFAWGLRPLREKAQKDAYQFLYDTVEGSFDAEISRIRSCIAILNDAMKQSICPSSEFSLELEKSEYIKSNESKFLIYILHGEKSHDIFSLIKDKKKPNPVLRKKLDNESESCFISFQPQIKNLTIRKWQANLEQNALDLEHFYQVQALAEFDKLGLKQRDNGFDILMNMKQPNKETLYIFAKKRIVQKVDGGYFITVNQVSGSVYLNANLVFLETSLKPKDIRFNRDHKTLYDNYNVPINIDDGLHGTDRMIEGWAYYTGNLKYTAMDGFDHEIHKFRLYQGKFDPALLPVAK